MSARDEDGKKPPADADAAGGVVAPLWPDGEGPLRREPPPSGDDAERLMLDLGAFEGPLDMLLEMARKQKVDLTQISILSLAEQYLEFIHAARRMRLELAADWLVMAAWLAWLKSRLLLPAPPEEDEPEPEEMAARLAFRLQRLQAMRDAADRLMSSVRLGRDVFARGMPEPLVVEKQTEYADTLVDLLRAYAGAVRRRAGTRGYRIEPQPVWTIKEAREVLERLVGRLDEWSRFDRMFLSLMQEPHKRASALASGFAAALELVREGRLEMRQEEHFRPIYMRSAAS